MGDDAVALHLTEAQAAVARAPLHGLPSQDLHRAAAPAVDLVIHLVQTRVTQALSATGGLRARMAALPQPLLETAPAADPSTALRTPIVSMPVPCCRACPELTAPWGWRTCKTLAGLLRLPIGDARQDNRSTQNHGQGTSKPLGAGER